MLLTWRIFYKQQDDKETEEDEEEGITPVSLCVPWQMSMKQVANINTVLTYI